MLNFPVQLIPEDDKNEQWHRQHIDLFINNYNAGGFSLAKEDEFNNYNTYNGLHKEALKSYLLAPHGKRVNMKYKVWPLARQKVRQLVTDFMARPLKKKVTSINKEAENRKEKHRLDLSLAKLNEEITQELSQMFGFDITEEGQSQNIDIPEDIDKYIDMTYKEASEVALQIGVDYLLYAQKLIERFKYGFIDSCISFKAFFKVYIEDGNPVWRRIDPRNCYYDIPYESEYLDDCSWFVEERWLTINQITAEYELTTDEAIQLARLAGDWGVGTQGGDSNWFYRKGISNEQSFSGDFKIRVVSMEWKSQMMKKVKISPNKRNPKKPFYKRVKDTYEPKVDKGERVESKIVDDIRKCTVIGGYLTKDWGRLENQVRSVDAPEKASLSYTGLVGDTTTDIQHSLVKELEYLQDFSSDILFTIRRISKKLGKRALVYDTAQIPKQFAKPDKNGKIAPLQRVFHHMDEDSIIAINSKDESQRGKSHQFNQFTEVNLSPSGDVTELVNLLMMIDELASKISGVAPQREGQTKAYETGFANKTAILSSNRRTEIYMKPYANLVQRVIEKAINLTKIAWQDGKKARFFMGDGGIAVLNALPDIAFNDYGFYLNDGGKDLEMKEIINNAALNFLNGTQEPALILEMIKVFKQETAEEAEQVLNKGVKRLEELQEQIRQSELESNEKVAEINKEVKEGEKEMKQKEIDAKIEVAKINANAKMDVAEVYSDDQRDIATAKETSKLHSENMKEQKASQNENNNKR